MPLTDHLPNGSSIAAFVKTFSGAKEVDIFSPAFRRLTMENLGRPSRPASLALNLAWQLAARLPSHPISSAEVLVVDSCGSNRHAMRQIGKLLSDRHQVFWLTSPFLVRATRKEIPVAHVASVIEGLAATPEGKAPESEGGNLYWHVLGSGLALRASALIARLKPRLVLLGADTDPFSTAVGSCAGRQGIPVVTLQHGVLNYHNCFGVCSHFLCWSDAFGEFIQKVNQAQPLRRPLLQVQTVGGLHRIEPLAPPTGPRRILFLDQQTKRGRRIWGSAWVDAVIQWLEKLADTPSAAGWIRDIRIHPTVKAKHITLPRGWRIAPPCPLTSDIAAADLVITMNSTAGVEAGAMGRAVIFLAGSDMVLLRAMDPLKEFFTPTPAEFVERAVLLMNDKEKRASYAEDCLGACRDFLGCNQSGVEGSVQYIRELLK